MRWQNPWAWLGLLTLVLPVLVHLFSRRPARVEPFPTLRFIDISRLLPTRRTRLSDVPLLIVRLLVLATAVAALAQPLWRERTGASPGTTVTALIVDTTAVAGDAAARARLEAALSDLPSASTAQLRIDTDRPADALAGAAAWLATQSGQHQVVIASDLRDGTLDSLDLALLPRDIRVQLVSPDGLGAPDASRVASARGVVQWAPASAAMAGMREAVQGTARALGAAALVDSLPPATARVIVVASPDADSLGAWRRSAGALPDAWMGDVIVRLRSDSTLVTASLGARVADTTLAPPFTVILRASDNAPVVAAAAIGGRAEGPARLLLWSRAPTDALATAALLLGASRALQPAAIATSGRAAPDSAQRRRWERAPAAPPTVVALARSGDPLTGPSDARWLWLVVLVLLAVETVMRRQARTVTAGSSMAAAAPSGPSRD